MRNRFYTDSKENAAFERCVDVMTNLIMKYGPRLKKKWLVEIMFNNLSRDVADGKMTTRRLGRYHKLSSESNILYRNRCDMTK